MVSAILLTCPDRTALDWCLAIAVDLSTLAWLGLLLAWCVG